jgi:hypothetical protein
MTNRAKVAQKHMVLSDNAQHVEGDSRGNMLQAYLLHSHMARCHVSYHEEVEICYVIPTSAHSEQIRFCHLLTDYSAAK